MRSLELFTGAGGLALGIKKGGFTHAGSVEFNHDACETLRFNRSLPGSELSGWDIYEGDTRSIVDFGSAYPGIQLVAGGPPCQPFSIGGKAKGQSDKRDMFPEAVRAVRQTKPLAFIFENVKGLLREAFSDYFEYVILQLTYPEEIKRPNEQASNHRNRLEKIHTKGNYPGLKYHVVWQLLNAADYGIPQKRERVFIVGFRSDLGAEWSFPSPTHSKHALDYSKFVSGEYFDEHKVSSKIIRKIQVSLSRKDDIARQYEKTGGLRRWQTTRDAIADLPCPIKHSDRDFSHIFVPGARPYPGHTGSHIDEPAKTLKAGDHGVPGGENMLLNYDGTVRYFTLREAARLQTFPDSYKFKGAWSEGMRQLGNAVPVNLGKAVAKSVHKTLHSRQR